MAKKKSKDDIEYNEVCGSFREVLKTSHGKSVIWHILSMCNIYSDVFAGDNTTFYLEGQRSVGLQILQVLEDVDPLAYSNLLRYFQKMQEN